MVPHRVGIRIRPLLAAAVLTITGTDGVALASTSPERDAPRTVPEWESTSAEGRRLLQRWAPVLHQLVDRAGDHSEDGRADLP
ncbi:MAG: hypothetical protein KC729_09000, partial [Candidatus Eisenbacteria bacterium]|nr:hypothetical protein [Candidatus Eisenbacteria bacterium]